MRLRIPRSSVFIKGAGALATATVLLASRSHGVDYTWTGANSTKNWSLSQNWSPSGVPSEGDSVIFPSNLSGNVNNNLGAGFGFTNLQFSGQYNVTGTMFVLKGTLSLGASGNSFPSRATFSQEVRPSNLTVFNSGTNSGNTLDFSNLYLSANRLDTLGAGSTAIRATACDPAGLIAQFGSGTLMLTGSFPLFKGSLYGAAGTVDLNIGCDMPSATVNIQHGGTLVGIGQASNIHAFGTSGDPAYVTPGSGSVGQLTATNSLIFDPYSVLNITVGKNSIRSNGAVQISGNATISLSVPTSPPVYSVGSEILLVEKVQNSPITGQFQIAEGTKLGGMGQVFLFTYLGGDGNDLVLRRLPTPVPTVSPVVVATAGGTRTVTVSLKNGFPTVQYIAESSPDLKTWTPFQTVTIASDGTASASKSFPASTPQLFVRFRAGNP